MSWRRRWSGCDRHGFAPLNRLPWPQSLAARTALVLLLGLALVQIAGLAIHALDRMDLQREAAIRDLGLRIAAAYRAVAMTPPPQREAAAREASQGEEFTVSLGGTAPSDKLAQMSLDERRLLRASMGLSPSAGSVPPRDFVWLGGAREGRVLVGLRLADGSWLSVRATIQPPRPWHSETFLIAFLLMSAAAALLTLWAVRRLTAPVRTLAAAAEALGRDVNAKPLPERGPTEVVVAAQAFNTMARRIRRFVQDRTELLTAIGHDLRTPITRLKLRSEFMEDDEQRARMLSDLADLEAMVAATLDFGRDATATEAVGSIDLAELCRTVLDEAGDTRPDVADKLGYAGPAHLTIRARSLALKRALTNLVGNAVNYGGGARVRLLPPEGGILRLLVDDDGPGLPAAELERVFEPFYRVEASRNRETGGTGLGLPITRNILRAHGGDVVLRNRDTGGLRAEVTLPV